MDENNASRVHEAVRVQISPREASQRLLEMRDHLDTLSPDVRMAMVTVAGLWEATRGVTVAVPRDLCTEQASALVPVIADDAVSIQMRSTLTWALCSRADEIVGNHRQRWGRPVSELEIFMLLLRNFTAAIEQFVRAEIRRQIPGSPAWEQATIEVLLAFPMSLLRDDLAHEAMKRMTEDPDLEQFGIRTDG
jgi:hypothetical protein